MSALGRGLDSLISNPGPGGSGDEAPRLLPITQIRPHPGQPRKTFDSGALEELRDSIRAHGLLQAICVRRIEGGYEIVSGERRWRAARLAGLAELPVTVLENVDDERLLELAMVENLQRQDLDPIEKARGFHELMERSDLTQEEVAIRVGLRRSTVANHLRLLELPEEVQEALVSNLLTMGHAKALLSLPKGAPVKKALARVVRDELSVRQTEKFVRDFGQGSPIEGSASGGKAAATEPAKAPAWVTDAERRIREALGVQAELKTGKGNKGQLMLKFADREELERLLEALAPKPQL